MVSRLNAMMAMADRKAELELGDDIEYAVGGADFVTIRGFVVRDNEALGFTDTDKLNSIVRIEISRAILPEISTSDRLRSAHIEPGTFRPTNWFKSEDGDDWWLEIQKA